MFQREASSKYDGRLSRDVLDKRRSFYAAVESWTKQSSSTKMREVTTTFQDFLEKLASERGKAAQIEKSKASECMEIVNAAMLLETKESRSPDEDILVLRKFIYLSGVDFYNKNLQEVIDGYQRQ